MKKKTNIPIEPINLNELNAHIHAGHTVNEVSIDKPYGKVTIFIYSITNKCLVNMDKEEAGMIRGFVEIHTERFYILPFTFYRGLIQINYEQCEDLLGSISGKDLEDDISNICINSHIAIGELQYYIEPKILRGRLILNLIVGFIVGLIIGFVFKGC